MRLLDLIDVFLLLYVCLSICFIIIIAVVLWNAFRVQFGVRFCICMVSFCCFCFCALVLQPNRTSARSFFCVYLRFYCIFFYSCDSFFGSLAKTENPLVIMEHQFNFVRTSVRDGFSLFFWHTK